MQKLDLFYDVLCLLEGKELYIKEKKTEYIVHPQKLYVGDMIYIHLYNDDDIYKDPIYLDEDNYYYLYDEINNILYCLHKLGYTHHNLEIHIKTHNQD